MASRQGVSPVLAVVILMSVAVVGGAFLSTIQNVFLQTALSEMEYKITDLRLEKDSQGGCYLFLSIFNSGSKVINKADFKTTVSSNEWSFNILEIGSGLEPGNSAKVFRVTEEIGKNTCGNLTTSETYSIAVNGSATDSTFNIIKAVKVNEVSQG